MNAEFNPFIVVFLRWIHLVSVVVLIGGLLYARYVAAPALDALTKGGHAVMAAKLTARFRLYLRVSAILLLVTGLFGFISKGEVPLQYQLLFWVKMVISAYIIVVSYVIAANPGPRERTRNYLMASVVVCGLVAVLISNYLRFISNLQLGR